MGSAFHAGAPKRYPEHLRPGSRLGGRLFGSHRPFHLSEYLRAVLASAVANLNAYARVGGLVECGANGLLGQVDTHVLQRVGQPQEAVGGRQVGVLNGLSADGTAVAILVRERLLQSLLVDVLT